MNTVLKILAWLFKYKPITRTIAIINRDPCRLRLHEWRSSPELTRQAYAAMHTGDMRVMLDVLEREHPASIVLPDGATMEERAIWQARSEGYTMCLANMAKMSEFEQPKGEMPTATFGTDDPQSTT